MLAGGNGASFKVVVKLFWLYVFRVDGFSGSTLYVKMASF